jgi:hypothetical protein
MYHVHVQKSNESNSKNNEAAEVGQTSASEDGATTVIPVVSAGIRIVERVVRLCII